MSRPPTHHFERVLIASLKRGDDQQFLLPDRALRGLMNALDADLDSPTAQDALDAALRLAAAFDGRLQSPYIAATIRTLLRENPRAVELLLQRKKSTSPIDEARAHARREDRELPSLSLNPKAPAGAHPLRTWLNTGNTQTRGRRSCQLKA